MEKRKLLGVILAGGHGTRLLPLTRNTNKHLLPIYNKLMIEYPIDTLKYLGVEDVLIVSGGNHIGGFAEYLGDGSGFGINLTFRTQKDAGGIAQALYLAKDFVGENPVAVILADNIFQNDKIHPLPEGVGKKKAYLVFKEVDDPERFGVPVFEDGDMKSLIGIEEKPKNPKSQYAVTGLYIYPPNVFDIIKDLKPSARGELEISDVNNWYIKQRRCAYSLFQGYWRDAGTVDSLKEVTNWAYAQ